ncbi:type III CRISPR-associated RAMP protein Csx7 [Candidatus Viridilinea mediisalina]|uniref:CRISPR-associated RAMP protein n=1 Tax=Candidatus Viridilinea mediisalina TaxID=2024553 RepID=A0A2A6RMG4_9CHLR|nr:CRISPR-associated RAMP protein Csx7 [Candidatus Viridilinea mediisalina]PDW04091.1 CRISPR-associated RAMP protein [Candidatus Viridilinea mediisalina]
MTTEANYSFAALRNRLTIEGWLVTTTALRIGAGRDSSVIGNDLPVLRDALGAPFIPGASLKGAFRARLEALVRGVAPGQVREIETEMRKGFAEQPDEVIWHDSSLIELTFGAPWLAGRIFFKDALVDRSLWFGQFEIRNGVALNRDTETAEAGLLYDYEVVPAGMRFAFALTMENAEAWQLGMILLALQPWERGEVQLGGFRSRGLGYVQLTDLQRRFVALQPGDADAAIALLDGTGGVEPDATQMQAWTAALRSKLTAHAEQATEA